mmetsp:Transcript_28898/g.44430  ORF Transcript_28898/g.44430 Transcript_28898/m.44430 type:complete len:97 (+) Transcript_28898:336-626(+)
MPQATILPVATTASAEALLGTSTNGTATTVLDPAGLLAPTASAAIPGGATNNNFAVTLHPFNSILSNAQHVAATGGQQLVTLDSSASSGEQAGTGR